MRRRRGERGAVLVEMVMMIPIFLMISLAVFDIGFGWKAQITISNTTRSGARVASNFGKDMSADQAALNSIAAGLADTPREDIAAIVIYKADSATGGPPAGCLTSAVQSAGGSAALKCNVYTEKEARQARNATVYTGDCNSSRDRFYCPSTRLNTQAVAAGPDYIGVFIQLNHTTQTKIFGSSLDIDDFAVMRIEPNAGNPPA